MEYSDKSSTRRVARRVSKSRLPNGTKSSTLVSTEPDEHPGCLPKGTNNAWRSAATTTWRTLDEQQVRIRRARGRAGLADGSVAGNGYATGT